MKIVFLPLTLFLTSALLKAQTSYTIQFTNYIDDTSFDNVNTLSTGEWYDGLRGLVYDDVLDSATSGYDVGAVLNATSTYYPKTPATNGNIGDDAVINMYRNKSVDFTFTLYDVATGDVVDTDFFGGDFGFSLVFYDIDGAAGNAGYESVTSYDHTSWSTLADSDVVISHSGNATTATASGDVSNVPNPTTSTTTLTEAQQRASVVYSYVNKGAIDLKLEIIGGHVAGERNFYIDGDDFTVFSYPTVPEPSSVLMLGLGSIFLFKRRR